MNQSGLKGGVMVGASEATWNLIETSQRLVRLIAVKAHMERIAPSLETQPWHVHAVVLLMSGLGMI